MLQKFTDKSNSLKEATVSLLVSDDSEFMLKRINKGYVHQEEFITIYMHLIRNILKATDSRLVVDY